MEPTEDTSEARIIVVELGGRTVGFKVDAVSEVLRLPVDMVEPPPSIVSGAEIDYIRGVGKLDDRLIMLLDVEKLLTDGEKEAVGSVAGSSMA